MDDYVKRLISEHSGLNERLRKLKTKIDDEKFMSEISNDKAVLLQAQYHAMETYAFILAQRLLIELNEGNCTLEDVQG